MVVVRAIRFILFFLVLTAHGAPYGQALTRRQSSVPQYVLDYAPLVWLDINEQYFPSDIGAQLVNTHPDLNYTPITGAPSPLTLENLNALNNLGGSNVYLTGNDDWTASPPWILGVKPDASGKTNGAVSCAVVVHDHNNGIVDVYYFYFYAYNQGDDVLGHELGDHLGDWEHTMIRLNNSGPEAVPQYVWFSEHSNGEAFDYSALEKTIGRPTSYSAKGNHANWATSGTHDHTIPDVSIPYGLIVDTTSQGTLWDPTASAYFYQVTFPEGQAADDSSNPTFTAYNGQDPVNWLYFVGQWGDDQLPDSDPRQKTFFGFKKYTAGPTGPEDKDLNRAQVCPKNGILCIIRPFLTPGD